MVEVQRWNWGEAVGGGLVKYSFDGHDGGADRGPDFIVRFAIRNDVLIIMDYKKDYCVFLYP